MEKSQKTLHRLERLRQLNTDRNWINDDLYRLLYKEDLYLVAYERIKSAPGNMTPGSDGKTMDGISMQEIHTIIREMQTEQFQFKAVRTVYIPKANGKKRKLGIPSTRDKIVQEVIRLILECIYESPHGPYFSETSHGFRLNLIWKLLRAGYLDLQEARHGSLAGTPQGGLAIPILENVYIHELDEKLEEIRLRWERGGSGWFWTRRSI